MLVLTRHPGETLTITSPGMNPIVITTIETRRNRVRLGIDADDNVKVVRTEIVQLNYTKRGAK